MGGTERTVIRVEGMDCASCAVTVEKWARPWRRAVVNFASGRLDAEHDPGLTLEEIEKAVRDAGYGVAKTEEVEYRSGALRGRYRCSRPPCCSHSGSPSG